MPISVGDPDGDEGDSVDPGVGTVVPAAVVVDVADELVPVDVVSDDELVVKDGDVAVTVVVRVDEDVDVLE